MHKDEVVEKEAQTTVEDAEQNDVQEMNNENEKNAGSTEDGCAVENEKDAKIEELQNRVLRLQADFDNFRRRTTVEKEQLATFVTVDVVGKFLQVLDNFERAEEAAKKTNDAAGVVAGMEMIKRQFEQTFKDLGVAEIEAAGQKFDPEVHEAVMRGQNSELDDDTVEMVFEKGYKLREKVIRHSKVKVISNE